MKRARWLSLAALCFLQACTPAVRSGTQVQAMPGQPDTDLTITDGDGRTLVIEVRSRSGIGHADISLQGRLPKQVILRLMLKGMERLDVQYGQTIITASLSSVPGYDVHEAIRLPSGEEREISSDSPYWMAVKIVPAEGSVAEIPLQEGHIQVRLPDALLKAEQRSFAIRWVDFFR